MAGDEKPIEEVLSYPIVLSEHIRKAADEADSFKFECSEVGKQVDRLCQMLRSAVRFASSTAGGSLYERPVRRIVAEVSKNLDRALTLVRKCRRRNVLSRVVSIVSAADFRKAVGLLESSIGDLKWLLSIFDYDPTTNTFSSPTGGVGGIVLSLPPIASNDPIIAWVWSYIASIYSGQLNDRTDAANQLSILAKDNDRNKQIIVGEGGVPPLLKLLKESQSPEAQIAAATALFDLANDRERVRIIADEAGVPIIVYILGDSPMRVQICAANLVARMAQNDPMAQEDFARENAIRPLVTLLSFETFVDDYPTFNNGKQSIHSIFQINKQMEKNSTMSFNYRPGGSFHMEGSSSSRGGNYRKERDNEKTEVKLELKISCAKALWMLAKGSISNSRRITETKGLLCLAKLVEKEQGELKVNCLMTIMEITGAAESNADLRRSAFKTNSPAAKAVVDQLLRVIKEFDSPTLQIPAIRSIGSLARTFSARENRVIGPLIEHLNNRNQDVAAEAAIALGKFASPDNFLHLAHSKTIIEFNGIPSLMRMLRDIERAQLHGLVLLCYLALHSGKTEVLEEAQVLTALEGAVRTVVAQHPDLKELVSSAIYHLNVYHSGVLLQR